MEKLVSIIVPAYNVEKYLSRCVQSLCSQTYKNLEIILIDDGSVDATPIMCDELEKKDNRIMVIHQKNRGQCAARNAALDIMKGEYLMFVDSDDYIRNDMVSKLVEALERNQLDFIRSAYKKVSATENEELIDSEDTNKEQVFDQRGIIENFLTAPYSKRKCFTAIMWAALYKSALFKDIRFPEGLIYEEGFVLPDVFLKSNSAGYIDESLYYYRRNNDGTMAQDVLIDKALKSVDSWKAIHNSFKDKYPEFNSITSNRWIQVYFKKLEKLVNTPGVDQDNFYKNKIIETLTGQRDYFIEMGVDKSYIKEIDYLRISLDKWKRMKQKEKHKKKSILIKIKEGIKRK